MRFHELLAAAAFNALCCQAAGGRALTADAGDVVTLTPPAEISPASAHWVELCGPGILLRKGEAPGPDLRVRPRVPGTYRLACLPDEGASLASARIVEVKVDSGAALAAQVDGPLLAGAAEEIVLGATAAPEVSLGALEARWKQLGGPKLRLAFGEARRRSLRVVPELPARYRFAVKIRAGRDWSPWATFTFEVPRRPDGSADRRPLARASVRGEGTVGRETVLDGSRSFDPDGDELAYVWEQVTGPRLVSAGELAGAGPRLKLAPAFAGEFTFALTVVDPFGLESHPEPVSFEVLPPQRPLEGERDPLDRPMSVLLEDAPVGALFSRLSDRGVAVRTAPELGDQVKLAARRIDLWVVDLPARRVLDWLGRMLDAFYVVEGPGSVWFTRGTRWLERAGRVAETHRIDALYLKDDASDLTGMLRESVRAVLWAGAGTNVGEPDLDSGTLTAILPRSAQGRVSDLIAELRRAVPSGPPLPPLEEDAEFSRLLARKVDGVYRDWTVREVAWDLARQARVTIGFDSLEDAAKGPGGNVGARRVTLDVGLRRAQSSRRVRLGGALAALVREAGLAGHVVEPPGAIWLHEGAPPPPTSQCMWQAAEIRSYDVRALESLHGFAGPMLVHLVRKRILPGRWEDPFVTVGYSRARGRLLVIHHEDVHRAVGALLDRLAREGQEALEE